jgi:hypothetical protein
MSANYTVSAHGGTKNGNDQAERLGAERQDMANVTLVPRDVAR